MQANQPISGHAFADHSKRFSVDQQLRNYGFRIAARRSGTVPLWELGGELFPQHEAVEYLDQDELDKAEFRDSL